MKQFIPAVLLICLTVSPLMAQTFEVKSFRLLQNDITAWMNPVRDLNHEACALIKVVGSPEFAFTTPLGIVLRKEQTGETWIYVPNGTIQLTIKHPRWGVLRDYPLPSPLESRLSYELVLIPPPPAAEEKETLMKARSIVRLPESTPPDFVLRALPEKRLTRRQPGYLILANIGQYRSQTSYGLTLGIVKRHGAYVHAQSNFRFQSSDGVCNKTGMLTETGQTPYYTKHVSYARHSITAGGLHHIAGLCFLYEGIGYGERTVFWQTIEGLQLENSGYSTRGITGEIGGLLKIHHLTVSLGIQTIRAKYWEPVFGIGINF